MAILNYTTAISFEKSAAEIQKILVRAKASAVLSEYDGAGVLTHISFRAQTPHGVLSFRLPANVDGVHRALQKTKGIGPKYRTRQQAARVAWRIIKDWIEAQLAIVEAEVAQLSEVFLPYAQGADGKTVYEKIAGEGYKTLAIINQKEA